MGKTAVDMHGIFPRYKGKFDALLSTHYAAAAILHDRELSLAQFEPARYDDPKLRKFAAEQVEVTIDPALTGVQAVVDAHTTDGRTLSMRCDHPRGSAENPLTRAQIEVKFRTYAKARLPAANVDAVIDAITRLEDFGSTRTLMDLLRGGSAQPVRESAAA
jgi:2-methylcitrate dehydratase PrpD